MMNDNQKSAELDKLRSQEQMILGEIRLKSAELDGLRREYNHVQWQIRVLDRGKPAPSKEL
jgi:hypothetical protein